MRVFSLVCRFLRLTWLWRDYLHTALDDRWPLEECDKYAQPPWHKGESCWSVCQDITRDVARRVYVSFAVHVPGAFYLNLYGEELRLLTPAPQKSITGHAPQFAGTDQHDSQEFLSFLLDGLHEDLNRVLNKPPADVMTPERESALETLPQQIASIHEWKLYRMRDDSLVVDYFQGQFRNRLQCLTCRKVCYIDVALRSLLTISMQTSTTYNSFMYLSLPIPSSRNSANLYQCLDAFVKEEVMEKADAW